MVKAEHQYLDGGKILAFAFEGQRPEDTETLDLLSELFQQLPNARQGFLDTKRLVVHVKPEPVTESDSKTS